MKDIKDYIPHRWPFLFVDKILEIDDNTIKTTKFISQNEGFFKGHYPGFPLMPGGLICEAVLQSGAILLAHILQEDIKDEIPVVTRMNNVKLKRMVCYIPSHSPIFQKGLSPFMKQRKNTFFSQLIFPVFH